MREAVKDYETVKQAVDAAAAVHGDPSWLIDRRLAAVDGVAKLPLPEMRRLDFHRWPLTANTELNWHDSDAKLADDVAGDNQRIQVVQVGQTTVSIALPQALADQGVILTDIFTAFKDYPELTQKYFMTKVIPVNEDKLTSYHAAFLNAGVFLYVPKGVVVDKPVEIYTVQDSTVKVPLVAHVLVVAEANSDVQVIQHLSTKGEEENVASCVVEIDVKPNANVHFSSLDEFGPKTQTYLNRRAYLEADAKMEWAIGMMNDANTIADFATELVGDGSQADSKVIAITSAKQHDGINNRVTNRGKHSTANILQRGVLLEKSELIFNGIGHIVHGASGANAEQENRVLMMSDYAHGDANPILLIDENDVIAGHAASVGQVDEDQLYYLMSRGIDKALAQRLVIRGFLGAVLSAIPLPEVQQEMIAILERKLEDGQKFE
ncbi:Fe-S cluster assembly protein SufD [Secundilactobacillus muriivasis]